jgi:putative DNA primase/helicase
MAVSGASIEDARAWLKRGAAILPLPLRSKIPVLVNWQDLRLTEPDLVNYFNTEPINIGVLLGAPSADLVDVDCDWPEAAAVAAVLLPRTAVFGRTSAPASHRLYQAAGAVTEKWKLPPSLGGDKLMVLELRSTGAQTVAPPSVHPSGEDVRWERQVKPARMDGAALKRRCALVAAAAVLARLAWGTGSRHELALAVAGAMLGSGWAEEEVTALVEAAAGAAGDLELADRRAAVRTTAKAIAAGQPATGLPRLAQLVGEELVGVLKRWLRLGEPLHGIHVGSGPASSDWAGESAIAVCSAIDVREAPVDWLWPNRIARGKLFMLAGKPGLSKSVLSCEIASIVTRGGAWPLDGTRCEAEDVLMLNVEDDPADTIKPRLIAAGAVLERVQLIEGVKSPDGKVRMMTLADVELLDKFLTGSPRKFALLVVDPIGAFLAGRDSHKEAPVRELLAPFGLLAQKHDVAVFMIGHLNKADGRQAQDRVIGTIGFVAAVRGLYILAPDPDDRERLLLLPEKTNNAPATMLGLSYRLESIDLGKGIVAPRVRWESAAEMRSASEVLNTGREPRERQEAEEWLRERLADGPVAVPELRREVQEAGLGFGWRTVETAKKHLAIVSAKVGSGWQWGLPTPQGRNAGTSQTGGEAADLNCNTAANTADTAPDCVVGGLRPCGVEAAYAPDADVL